MEMATKTKSKAGGGANSNKLKQVGVNVGPRSTQNISECGVSQIGQKLGNREAIEPIVEGNAKQVPLGNDLAKNVGKGGPGTGRTVAKTGSQGHH
jgi:hypothetical protein